MRLLSACLQVQDDCNTSRIDCKDKPLFSEQVSDSKLAFGHHIDHHMSATCALPIAFDLSVCPLEVWGCQGAPGLRY